MPKYTVGITTYNRLDFLRESVSSVINQTFEDVDIIIGNDYQKKEVLFEDLGIHDCNKNRVRIINYPENLGEVGNLNELLANAEGEYFIWLADDDLFNLKLFESVNCVLEDSPELNVIVPGCLTGMNYNSSAKVNTSNYEVVDGIKYLDNYLLGNYRLQGVYLIFKTDYLKKIGGLPVMSSFKTPYFCDGALALYPGLENRVGYVHEELVFFRLHPESLSYTTTDITNFFEAEKNYVRKFINLFESNVDNKNFKILFHVFLKSWVLSQFYDVWLRSGRSWSILLKFNIFFFKQLRLLSFKSIISVFLNDYMFQKKKVLHYYMNRYR